MTEAPPQVPAQQEQLVAQKLIACGLQGQSFTVKYEPDLQSLEITIAGKAAVVAKNFPCIHRAAGDEIVTFEDRALQSGYLDFDAELHRPEMIARATASAKALGLIDGFPRRREFEDLQSYARALERHCGLVPGSTLTVNGDAMTFDPPREAIFGDFEKKYAKLFAAIMYASALGDLEKFGFIGNEAVAEPK